ncbi:AsmA family protein [Pseudoxanthomonas composti]|uniref:AsmA family protein n=1 Tax=Pseudoxanthomonas composti TaxID=2137479 RepID=A0A4Q1JZE4_9GAMM|nr:AsmA family protein [Pseudoxanthomonas composti]RXR08694.1 AsmA family protein [Pseudoxanthomonas composti]
MPTATATRPSARRILLALLGLLAAAILILILLWDWNWFKGPIERAVYSATGREFHIDGNLDVDLGRVTTISAEGLRLADASWAKRKEMATVQRLELDVRPWAFIFKREIAIPGLRLTKPEVVLESGPKGGGNWVFDTPDKDPADDRPLPSFGLVQVRQGRLQYIDAPKKTDLDIRLETAQPGKDEAAPPIDLRGSGHWAGNRFTLEGRTASPLQLTDTDKPYRIDLRAAAGATRAHVRGNLIDPLKFAGFDVKLALSGQDMADLYPLIGIAIPASPPYRIDGRLTRQGDTWHYDGFSGQVGNSDLGGNVAVTVGRERPLLKADLHSKRLDFDDLAGFLGAKPDPEGPVQASAEQKAEVARQEAKPTVLPDSPYDLSKLRAMDADVKWKAQRINAPKLPIDDMDAHLTLTDGLLQLHPLNFGVAGGNIRSQIKMDARAPVISTRADISVRGLNLGRLFPDAEITKTAIGRIGGDMRIDTRGNSIAAMAGNANGEVGIGMGKGQLPQLLVELAGLDVMQSLAYLFDQSKQIPVRCAFADFGVKDGLMRSRALAFDTTDTLIVGDGNIDLKREGLELTLRPRPKDRSILSFRTPLQIGGTFKDPSFRPDLKKLGLRGAVALALGSIAPPAALLATIELGPGEDANCGGQYAK